MTNDLIDILLVITPIFAGLWGIHTFINAENKAGLSINYKSVELIKRNNGEFYLDIIVNVKNVGNRELGIELNTTSLSCYKIHPKNEIQKTLQNLKNKNGLHGRLSTTNSSGILPIRSGVDYDFPFSLCLTKSGRYFLEFKLKSEMDIFRDPISYTVVIIRRQLTKLDQEIFKLFGQRHISDKDRREIDWVATRFYYIPKL